MRQQLHPIRLKIVLYKSIIKRTTLTLGGPIIIPVQCALERLPASRNSTSSRMFRLLTGVALSKTLSTFKPCLGFDRIAISIEHFFTVSIQISFFISPTKRFYGNKEFACES
ncbi:hypothetical protein V1477_012076, partial [Vespula maculifrons]